MILLALAGSVLQLIGLLDAGIGLRRAWKQRNRVLSDFLAGMLGRPAPEPGPEPAIKIEKRAAPIVGMSAVGFVKSVEPGETALDFTLAEHLDLIGRATARAHDANLAVGTLSESVEELRSGTEEQLAKLRSSLQTYVQEETANAVPLAARGLLITAVGTVLQVIATAIQLP